MSTVQNRSRRQVPFDTVHLEARAEGPSRLEVRTRHCMSTSPARLSFVGVNSRAVPPSDRMGTSTVSVLELEKLTGLRADARKAVISGFRPNVAPMNVVAMRMKMVAIDKPGCWLCFGSRWREWRRLDAPARRPMMSHPATKSRSRRSGSPLS